MLLNHCKIWIFSPISKRIHVSNSWSSFRETKVFTGLRKEVKMRNYSGFTLIELIVVIALISILSGIAIPNIIVWRQNSQLSGAIQDVYSNLQKAKVEAIKRRAYIASTFSSDGYVIYVDSNKDLVPDVGEEVIASISLSDYGNVSFDASEGGGDGLTFSNPTDGIAFSGTGLPKKKLAGIGSGIVYLKHDNNRTARAIVSPSGSIRLE
jgi:type IV fimbrial biogenesis protein FimT